MSNGMTPTGIEDAIAHGFGSDEALRPAPRTIRVRISVAVDDKQRWYAHGSSGHGYLGDWSKDMVLKQLSRFPPVHVVWIEADVPLPEETVVEGRVV